MKLMLYDNQAQPPKVMFFPESTLLLKNRPFYLPDYVGHLTCLPCLAVKVDRVGKSIMGKFAASYYHEAAVALKFTSATMLEDRQKRLLPGELSYSFDSSTPISSFRRINLISQESITVLNKGEIICQTGASDISEKIHQAIVYLSSFMILKMGDLIFIPLAVQTTDLSIQDKVMIRLGAETVLSCEIK